MIGIVLFLFIFVCVSSVFYPPLRTLAKSLLVTVAVVIGGFWMLVEILHK